MSDVTPRRTVDPEKSVKMYKLLKKMCRTILIASKGMSLDLPEEGIVYVDDEDVLARQVRILNEKVDVLDEKIGDLLEQIRNAQVEAMSPCQNCTATAQQTEKATEAPAEEEEEEEEEEEKEKAPSSPKPKGTKRAREPQQPETCPGRIWEDGAPACGREPIDKKTIVNKRHCRLCEDCMGHLTLLRKRQRTENERLNRQKKAQEKAAAATTQ